MLSLFDRASMERALTLPLDPALRALLADRIGRLDAVLVEMTHLIVVDACTTERELLAETGMSPLVNPADGARYGRDATFLPWWDHLARDEASGFFDLIVCVGDSGFAYHLLVGPECTIPGLLAMCREHAA